MSELVEKVARAIARQRWTEEAADPNLIDAEVEYGWDTYADEALAAIAAVAEWLAQSEDRECNPLQALAAALRAAAEGSAPTPPEVK